MDVFEKMFFERLCWCCVSFVLFLQAYHLAVTFSSIANPAACFTTFFFISRSLWTICSLCVLGSGFAAYVLYTAALSPNPLFVNMEYKLFTVVGFITLPLFLH